MLPAVAFAHHACGGLPAARWRSIQGDLAFGSTARWASGDLACGSLRLWVGLSCALTIGGRGDHERLWSV
jgi:hypothetical protein